MKENKTDPGEFSDLGSRSAEWFRLVVESTPNAMVLASPAGAIVLVNAETERLFGYERTELIGRPVELLVPERFRAQHPGYRAKFLSEPRPRSMGAGRDLFGLRKDGTEVPVEIGLNPMETDEGTFVLSAIVDITERQRASKELRRMRAYLKNVVDSMPSILVGVDPEGCVTAWNQSAERSTRITADQAIGRRFAELFPELRCQADKVAEAILQRLPVSAERVVTEREGEACYADVMVYPLVANGAVGAVIRVDDVTQRVRIEEMLVQTEKMMSVGGLAAGMAHEINNPLSAVFQGCQNLRRRLSPELPANWRAAEEVGLDLEAVHRYLEQRKIPGFLDDIEEAAGRATRIVADMLGFSRRSTRKFTAANVSEMLDTVVRLAENDYDLKKQYDFRQIDIVRDYEPAPGPVCCDRTEIEQVFLNLIRNAAQAMASGDREVRPRIALRTRREDGYMCVEVEDNGPGMDEKTRQRVFEPFFTTKPLGIGTGLGLSVSFFIITEQHGGNISVSSTRGDGTCFVLHLPLGTRIAP